MIKLDELTNPKSCMSRAHDDEMVFVLLEHDEAAPDTIRAWAAKRVSLGKNKINDPQIQEAFACADYMDQKRTEKLHVADRTMSTSGLSFNATPGLYSRDEK